MRTGLTNPAAILVVLTTPYLSCASPLPDYPLVYAEGAATRELPPDIGTFNFTLTARHASSDGAIAQIPLADIPAHSGFGGHATAMVAMAAPRLMARAAVAPEDTSLVPPTITIREGVNVLFELQ